MSLLCCNEGKPITRGEVNVTGITRRDVLLLCPVSGYPVEKVEWWTDNKIIRGPRPTPLTNGTLLIKVDKKPIPKELILTQMFIRRSRRLIVESIPVLYPTARVTQQLAMSSWMQLSPRRFPRSHLMGISRRVTGRRSPAPSPPGTCP